MAWLAGDVGRGQARHCAWCCAPSEGACCAAAIGDHVDVAHLAGTAGTEQVAAAREIALATAAADVGAVRVANGSKTSTARG